MEIDNKTAYFADWSTRFDSLAYITLGDGLPTSRWVMGSYRNPTVMFIKYQEDVPNKHDIFAKQLQAR